MHGTVKNPKNISTSLKSISKYFKTIKYRQYVFFDDHQQLINFHWLKNLYFYHVNPLFKRGYKGGYKLVAR